MNAQRTCFEFKARLLRKLARESRGRALSLLLLIGMCSWVVPTATADEYKISLIASSISNPELGNFNAALATPVIEGDYVVFRTQNSVGTVAFIWSYNLKSRQFTKLVDLSTAAPGGTGNFTDLNAGMGGPYLKDGIVIFGARDSKVIAPPSLNMGIYSVPVNGGAIQLVANYNTPVPGGTGTFFNFGGLSSPTGNFSFSDGIVGLEADFGGGPIGNTGIYQSNINGENLLPIADSMHGIGLLFPITNFTHVSVDSGRAAFIGGSVFGYHTLFSTTLPAVLANYNEVITVDTPLPGTSGGFQFVLPSVRLFGSSIFFIALDSAAGGNNNRRTLFEIPFAGGSPSKILSNFDSLEGISSIELSSISSYDVNNSHLLIRAKAPGSTPEQGLYLYDRAAHSFTRIFRVDQQILDRFFGIIAEVQPGSMTEDSSSVVVSIAGSQLFVGPYTYIVLLSKDAGSGGSDDIAQLSASLLDAVNAIRSALVEARKKLPAKPSMSLPKAKRAKINSKRKAILAARKSLSALLQGLADTEGASGDILRTVHPNFSRSKIRALGRLRKTATSAKTDTKVARKAWRHFSSGLTKLVQ